MSLALLLLQNLGNAASSISEVPLVPALTLSLSLDAEVAQALTLDAETAHAVGYHVEAAESVSLDTNPNA